MDSIENPNPVDGRRNFLGLLGEIGSAGVTVFPDGRAEFTRPPSREEPQPMTRPVTIRADRVTYHVDPNWTRAGRREQDDRACRFWGVRADPLAAMTCHRDTHTLERLPLPPAPSRKPLLIVPDGCVLVIPDDVQPWEFLARFDTSQSSRTGMIVNKGGYRLLGGIAEQQQTERAEERRTHAALTFEQPIQNRLGRMAR